MELNVLLVQACHARMPSQFGVYNVVYKYALQARGLEGFHTLCINGTFWLAWGRRALIES